MNDIVIETPEQFRLYALLKLKAALKLECAGMRHSKGHSAYGIVKRSYGFKGNREAVLKQFTDKINEMYSQQ
jgi:hypothetical protein